MTDVDVYWNRWNRRVRPRAWPVREGGRVHRHVREITLRDVSFVVHPAAVARVQALRQRAVCAYARGIPCEAPRYPSAGRVDDGPERRQRVGRGDLAGGLALQDLVDRVEGFAQDARERHDEVRRARQRLLGLGGRHGSEAPGKLLGPLEPDGRAELEGAALADVDVVGPGLEAPVLLGVPVADAGPAQVHRLQATLLDARAHEVEDVGAVALELLRVEGGDLRQEDGPVVRPGFDPRVGEPVESAIAALAAVVLEHALNPPMEHESPICAGASDRVPLKTATATAGG
ncbi:MAG: hypothetical protein PGN34_01220 [Methylobacterium frigidaeris]